MMGLFLFVFVEIWFEKEIRVLFVKFFLLERDVFDCLSGRSCFFFVDESSSRCCFRLFFV